MKKLLCLFALLPLLVATPALAYITAPTSVTISSVNVYRNLAETGDYLVMFHYSMPYTSDNYTTTPASESVMFRLYDTDGTTLLDSGVPYVNPYFGSNGYGEGVGSFYLSASDSPPDWEDAVVINIFGTPAFFSPAFTQSYILTEDAYITETSQDANRTLLRTYILLECDKLTASYSDTGITLKATSDAGIVLSAYGDLYFRGVVDGLQLLCPELFFIQTLIPEEMVVTEYDMSLGETYAARLDTDDLGKGFDRMGDLIGVGGGFFSALLVFIATIGLSIWASRKGWGAEIGLMGGAIIGVGMAILMGDVVFTIMMVGSLAAGIGIVWLVFLKKA
jgi:hypothetical protein